MQRIRNVGSPSLARLTNETVVAIYHAAEGVVGEGPGQHLRVTMSRAGEGKDGKCPRRSRKFGRFTIAIGREEWDADVGSSCIRRERRQGEGRLCFTRIGFGEKRECRRQEKSVPMLGFGSKTSETVGKRW